MVIALILSLSGAARAQDEGGAGEPAAKPKPAAKQPASRTGPQDLLEIPAPSDDPAVTTILEMKRTEPGDYFRAARSLAGLKRPDLARQMIRELLALKLNEDQLVALSDEFGPATVAGLSSQAELLPEADQLARRVLTAVNRRLQDPKLIAGLIQQLQDPSAENRAKAMAALGQGRAAAIGALISVLADPQRAAEHAAVRTALAEMRGDSLDALYAALADGDPALKFQAIAAIAETKAPGASLYLLGPALDGGGDAKVRAAAREALVRLIGKVPSQAEATKWLYDRARYHFQNRLVLKFDADGRVPGWRWDTAAKRCVPESLSAEDASRQTAARLARDAAAISPNDPAAKMLATAATLDELVYRTGLDKPLDTEKDPSLRAAAASGTQAVEALLAYAMTERHPAAARAAAEILGRTGKAEQLLRGGTAPSPLVRAVRNPDRRLRLAAAEAIVRLAPEAPYAGSSHVAESLGFFAATRGARRAILASPRRDTLQEFAGALMAVGIEVETAATGAEAVRLAIASPDCELVLIDAGIAGPMAEDVVQMLHQDYRTASVPVGVVARDGYFDRSEKIARGDPLALAMVRAHTRETAQSQLDPLLSLAPADAVKFEERQQQAARALACLATLASSARKVYDLQRVEAAVSAGSYVPGLGGRVAAVLANMGTRDGQTALVEMASRHAQPLDVRKAAAQAFEINTQKYGLLLSDEAVRRQYQRYDRSAELDMNSQQVLGSLLDSIEEKLDEKRLAEVKKWRKKKAGSGEQGAGSKEKAVPAKPQAVTPQALVPRPSP